MGKNIATTLSFLVSGFWNHTNRFNNKRILDSLPMTEYEFISACYPLAEAIEGLNINKQNSLSSYYYEDIEDQAAKILYDYMDQHKSIPSTLEFIEQFKPKLNSGEH